MDQERCARLWDPVLGHSHPARQRFLTIRGQEQFWACRCRNNASSQPYGQLHLFLDGTGPPIHEVQELLCPNIAARWVITEHLAKGSQGHVYVVKSQDHREDAMYAMKVTIRNDSDDTADEYDVPGRGIISHESLITALVSDATYSVNLLATATHGSFHFAVQELIVKEFDKGEIVIKDAKKEYGQGLRRARRFFSQMASYLWAIHDRGIVHKDLQQPTNVLIDAGKNFVATDLGFANVYTIADWVPDRPDLQSDPDWIADKDLFIHDVLSDWFEVLYMMYRIGGWRTSEFRIGTGQNSRYVNPRLHQLDVQGDSEHGILEARAELLRKREDALQEWWPVGHCFDIDTYADFFNLLQYIRYCSEENKLPERSAMAI